mmetsp:Transcript_1571/g.4200  ORF Transcript_1571/g.4200 Transcript_1571/m.4200 type:complete len:281 (-) Transcript_1571:755-1597(-)
MYKVSHATQGGVVHPKRAWWRHTMRPDVHAPLAIATHKTRSPRACPTLPHDFGRPTQATRLLPLLPNYPCIIKPNCRMHTLAKLHQEPYTAAKSASSAAAWACHPRPHQSQDVCARGVLLLLLFRSLHASDLASHRDWHGHGHAHEGASHHGDVAVHVRHVHALHVDGRHGVKHDGLHRPRGTRRATRLHRGRTACSRHGHTWVGHVRVHAIAVGCVWVHARVASVARTIRVIHVAIHVGVTIVAICSMLRRGMAAMVRGTSCCRFASAAAPGDANRHPP